MCSTVAVVSVFLSLGSVMALLTVMTALMKITVKVTDITIIYNIIYF